MILKKKFVQKGFTLVEIVIAIAVVSVIGAITTPVVVKNLDKAHDSKVEMNLRNLEKSFESYYYNESGNITPDAEGDFIPDMLSTNTLKKDPSDQHFEYAVKKSGDAYAVEVSYANSSMSQNQIDAIIESIKKKFDGDDASSGDGEGDGEEVRSRILTGSNDNFIYVVQNIDWLDEEEEGSKFTVDTNVVGVGTVNPSEHIEVEYGKSVSFTITPSGADNQIKNVSGCGGNLENNTYTTGLIIRNCTVNVEFDLVGYTLRYLTDENGYIEGSSVQRVKKGETGSMVKATPNLGYSFSIWEDGIANESRQDTPTAENITVKALFEPNEYVLTYSASANGSVNGNLSQNVLYKKSGTPVEAIPDEGYYFEKWNDDSLENPRIDSNISGDVTVEALFAAGYLLRYTAGDGGTIDGDQNQVVNFGENGTEVLAIPNEGFSFAGWSDGVLDNPRTDLNVESNVVVEAEFNEGFSFTYLADTGGYILGEAVQKIKIGETGTEVEAVSISGFYFDKWDDGVTESKREDLGADENKTVTALFKEGFLLNYKSSGGGTVLGDDRQYVGHGEDGSQVTALSEDGYVFTGWDDGVATESRTETFVNEDVIVTANFEPVTYTLTYTYGPGGSLSGNTMQTVPHGSDGTEVVAVPDHSYYFVEWNDGETTSRRTDSNVTEDNTYSATFSNEYPVIYNYDETLVESFEGVKNQRVSYGEDASQVRIIPKVGYYFYDWSDGLTQNPRTDTNVTSKIEVTADIRPEEFDVKYIIDTSNATFTGEAEQTVSYGNDSTPVEIFVDPLYKFSGWDDGSTDNPRFDENITEHIMVTAIIEEKRDFYEEDGIIYCEDAEPGDEGVVNGVTYKAYDTGMLHNLGGNSIASETACTSHVSNMSDMVLVDWSFNRDIGHWDVSNVSNMRWMFRYAVNFNRDISKWDTSNVIDMSGMFENADNFNQPIGDWNTGKVVTMESMFENADKFNQPINNWDVSSVTNMSHMFDGSNFNQAIGGWDTGNVNNMESMFERAEFFNRDINTWDVSSVVNMRNMFNYTANFNRPLNNWDVSNVTDMYYMFAHAFSFNQNISDWEPLKVTDMSYMFAHTSSFDQPIELTTPEVTTMDGMFYGASTFNSLVTFHDLSRLTNMSSMFRAASSFNQNINHLDVSNVTNMNSMFYDALAYNQPLNSWDVSKVSNMSSMFRDASAFNQDISSWCVGNISSEPSRFSSNAPLTHANKPVWGTCPDIPKFYAEGGTIYCNLAEVGDSGTVNSVTYTAVDNETLASMNPDTDNYATVCTSHVTDMSGVFKNGSTFNQNINTWDTSNVLNMSEMFYGSSIFNQPVSNWDTSKVEDMTSIFEGATSFNKDISNWDFSRITYISKMFKDAVNFNQPLNNLNVSRVNSLESLFEGATTFNQPINSWQVSNVQNISNLFKRASEFNQDISSWDVKNITDMSSAFEGATFFNQSLFNWDVKNVTNMSYMFNNALSFNQDLSEWCVTNVVSEPVNFSSGSALIEANKPVWGECFYFYELDGIIYCEGAEPGDEGIVNGVTYKSYDTGMLHALGSNAPNAATACTSHVSNMSDMDLVDWSFNRDIGHWDVSNVSNMRWMFRYAGNFNRDISKWDTSNVIDMSGMFENANNFNQPIGDWNTGKVVTMESMFENADKFNQPINNWDVSSVTNMSHMFDGSNFNQAIGGWDTGNVNNMESMFERAEFFNRDINTWDVSSVVNMRNMFNYTANFNRPLNNWDVSNVEDMYYMFAYADSFNQNISDWEPLKVTDMSYMFAHTSSFNQPIELTTPEVTTMDGMFYGASTFNSLVTFHDLSRLTNMSSMFRAASSFNQNINHLDVSNVTNMNSMFYDALAYNQPLNNWDVSKVSNMSSMFRDASAFNQDISSWCVGNISSEPSRFSSNAPLTHANKPVWGTCP